MFAAVDLGSNSFRLIVGKVGSTAGIPRITVVQAWREPVRLAAGLDANGFLDDAAVARGVLALQRFGEHLRAFDGIAVRAVATNALRVARNANGFLAVGRAALGHPIEVISGQEEARLIYAGAAHGAVVAGGGRLVVDIGGGSTELCAGVGEVPQLLHSLPLGCVAFSQRFFAGGGIDPEMTAQAIAASRAAVQPLVPAIARLGPLPALGASGTALALADLIQRHRLDPEAKPATVTRAGLEQLKAVLLQAGHVAAAPLAGLAPDRIPILPGGLAIMLGIFDALALRQLTLTDGALWSGLMLDPYGSGARSK